MRIENNPIYFPLCVSSGLCWPCLIVCLQYVITLRQASSSVHTFQPGSQKSRNMRTPDGHVKHSTSKTSLVWMNISGDNERAGQRLTGPLEWFALISIISYASLPQQSLTGPRRVTVWRCQHCNKKSDSPGMTPPNCSLLSRCQSHCPAPSLRCEEERRGGDVSAGHDLG